MGSETRSRVQADMGERESQAMTFSNAVTPSPALSGPLLQVRGLTVDFPTDRGRVPVVEDVSFDLERGHTIGLVGESGSGKSVLARAMLGLVAPSGRIVRGEVRLEGRDLVTLRPRELSGVRGKEVAMIFQQPRRSLDPAFTVGHQIAEIARRHLKISRRDAWKRAVEMLDRVHIPMATRRVHDYPHQLSGGMCQRVMLAMALVANPKVLIADEPTTALDVTVQARILDLIREIQREFSLTVLFITHDLGVVAEMCDRVVVMYAGQVVENTDLRTIFRGPKHPYSQALLDSLPQLAQDRLIRIPGSMPTPGGWPEGCRFSTRCGHCQPQCLDGPIPLETTGNGHLVRCVRKHEIALRGIG